jgi:hypothetical protein
MVAATVSSSHRNLGSGVLVVAALAVGPSACVMFAPFQARPATSGQVVSGTDGKPVAGAPVTVETWRIDPQTGQRRYRRHSAGTHTDGEGRWAVPRELDWGVAVLAGDGLPEHASDFHVGEGAAAAVIQEREAAGPDGRGAAVQRGGWLARFDPPRGDEGPRVLPAFGLLGSTAQSVCGYGGALFVIGYQPMRWAVRTDAEVGLGGLGGLVGLSLGAPTGTLPLLNADVGLRVFRRWKDDERSQLALGPAIGVSLANLRFLAGLVRGVDADAMGRRRWDLQLGIGLGYM